MKSDYREIWATPIAEYWLEDLSIHEELVNHINIKYQNFLGDNTMHLFDKDIKFSLWVKECIKHYTSQFNFPVDNINIGRAWAISQKYGDETLVHTHSHTTTDLACVYYVEAVKEHPSLEILDPRQVHKFNRVRRKLKDGNIATGFFSIQIPPEKYKLVIHPAYLNHFVPVNMTQIPRVSVAMNVQVIAPDDYNAPVTLYS